MSKGLYFCSKVDQIFSSLKPPKQFSQVKPARSLLLTGFPATGKGAVRGRVHREPNALTAEASTKMLSVQDLITQNILTLMPKHKKAPLE